MSTERVRRGVGGAQQERVRIITPLARRGRARCSTPRGCGMDRGSAAAAARRRSTRAGTTRSSARRRHAAVASAATTHSRSAALPARGARARRARTSSGGSRCRRSRFGATSDGGGGMGAEGLSEVGRAVRGALDFSNASGPAARPSAAASAWGSVVVLVMVNGS